MQQSQTYTCLQETGTLEHRQMSHNTRFPTMWFWSKASDQAVRKRSLIRAFASRLNFLCVKLLAEHHLQFLSLKVGCTGSSESIHVKMPHCWKSHVTAQIRNTPRSQNTISKSIQLYFSENITKLEMTQYKRLTRSAKHEPPANTTKIVSEYDQEITQSSDKPMAL